jgi:hypothetical protein
MIAVIFAVMVGAGVMMANVPVSDGKKLIDENRTSISVSYEKMDGATKITRVVVIPDASIPKDCNESKNSLACNYKWGRESMIMQDSKIIAIIELDAKALDCSMDKSDKRVGGVGGQCVERKVPLTDAQWEFMKIPVAANMAVSK